tara:strand:+ start:855 stop:1022 length:168 start_codon:yes stop_codon:yes gene_type:complete
MKDKSQKQIREFYEVNGFALQVQELNKSGMSKKDIKTYVLNNIDSMFLDTESESA